jgi:crotonobetainyl-CoA:carnitine CoA-transferase CaiB-like acyl-CoA transferase
MTLSPRPLEGLKVVDFGAVAVEPVNTKHLADYGATVIRIESHRSPDVLRFARPYYKLHIDGSMYFANYNTSKLSVSLKGVTARRLGSLPLGLCPGLFTYCWIGGINIPQVTAKAS